MAKPAKRTSSGPDNKETLETGTPAVEKNGNYVQSVAGQQASFRRILSRVLNSEIIPRIYDSSGLAAADPASSSVNPADGDAAAFQELVIGENHAEAAGFLQARLDGGASLRSLCLGLFTTVARNLGEGWLRDEISFADVTMGLSTLHLLLHQFSSRDPSIKVAGERHNIILASGPAEQHAFGMLIVSKIFEMEGWLVTGGPELHTGEDLTSIVAKNWFDIIGLTASTEDNARALEGPIERLREVSLNQSVAVMVGGNGFAENPGIGRQIGADDVAADADEAIVKARELLRKMDSGPEG